MSLLDDAVRRLTGGISAFIGDGDLMLAAVSAAAQVMASHDTGIEKEVETALNDLKADTTLSKGVLPSTMKDELSAAIDRTRTSSGRIENMGFVTAIKDRPVEQRNGVCLIALDVAAADRGISDAEDYILNEIADVLNVDRTNLMIIAKARAFISGTPEPEQLK